MQIIVIHIPWIYMPFDDLCIKEFQKSYPSPLYFLSLRSKLFETPPPNHTHTHTQNKTKKVACHQHNWWEVIWARAIREQRADYSTRTKSERNDSTKHYIVKSPLSTTCAITEGRSNWWAFNLFFFKYKYCLT